MAATSREMASSLVEADFSGQEGPGPLVNNYGSVVSDFFFFEVHPMDAID